MYRRSIADYTDKFRSHAVADLEEGEELAAAARGVASGINTWALGLIILGGLAGFVVAAATGFGSAGPLYTTGGVFVGIVASRVIIQNKIAKTHEAAPSIAAVVAATNRRLLVYRRNFWGAPGKLIASFTGTEVEGIALNRPTTVELADGRTLTYDFPRGENVEGLVEAVAGLRS